MSIWQPCDGVHRAVESQEWQVRPAVDTPSYCICRVTSGKRAADVYDLIVIIAVNTIDLTCQACKWCHCVVIRVVQRHPLRSLPAEVCEVATNDDTAQRTITQYPWTHSRYVGICTL